MPDVFEPEKRSDVMSKIRSKNTKVELIVFSYLRKQKIYHQKHYDKAPGKPDIALPRKKLAVFIDGEFWHGKTFNELKIRRGSDDDFWVKKIARNMHRDIEQQNALEEHGWKVLRVWDSDIKRKRTRLLKLQEIAFFLQNEGLVKTDYE